MHYCLLISGLTSRSPRHSDSRTSSVSEEADIRRNEMRNDRDRGRSHNDQRRSSSHHRGMSGSPRRARHPSNSSSGSPPPPAAAAPARDPSRSPVPPGLSAWDEPDTQSDEESRRASMPAARSRSPSVRHHRPSPGSAPMTSVAPPPARAPPLSTAGPRYGSPMAPLVNTARSRSPHSPSSKRDRTDRKDRGRERERSRARSKDKDSGNEGEEEYERKRLERKLREKEAAYQERLRKWESRERKRAKDRVKEKEREKARRKDELKEAKKLKEFLEDYDDERDDNKYYKSEALVIRRNDYKKEVEADAKDRTKEREELEEIRQRLINEGIKNPDEELVKIQKDQEMALQKKLLGDVEPDLFLPSKPAVSAAPTTQEHPRRDVSSDDDDDGLSSDSQNQEPYNKKPRIDSPGRFSTTAAVPATSTQPIGFTGIKLGSQAPTSATNQVFGDEDTSTQPAMRKLIPIDYTAEEQQSLQVPARPLSDGEKKKLIKSLIERIPTDRDDLFNYSINWEYVDETLIQKRLRPWVNKKFIEYIGDDESSLVDLVDFICQKVSSKTGPEAILTDVGMVLDDEAEVFVVKMWRLLIYEIEAKKYGLVKIPDS